MATIEATQSEILKEVRALLASGKTLSAQTADRLTLALLADIAEKQDKANQRITRIEKVSIGVFIERHKTLSILIVTLIIITLELIPDYAFPVIAKALGIPLP